MNRRIGINVCNESTIIIIIIIIYTVILYYAYDVFKSKMIIKNFRPININSNALTVCVYYYYVCMNSLCDIII